MLECLSPYIHIYGDVRPDNQYHAHSHCMLILIPDIAKRKSESERERDCTQRFIKDKYTLFISTRATLLQRYLSAYNKDVASNKVATHRSVQSRNANTFCYVLLAKKKNQQMQNLLISLRSPFNVLHSVLVIF